MNNLDRMKAAYKAWDACKGREPDCWLDLFADNVSIRSLANDSHALSFAQDRKSKSEAVTYFTSLAERWTMIHWSPHTFVSEGDNVAVFATRAWTNKQTGKHVETSTAHLWAFEGDRATSVIEIFDSARVLAAATP
ncbi:MAG: nuclear transport factor 2 family protein [Hyphomicrobiaceae bacterium]|nr:nuclear transport factor 2 family protein [Hyphomicrobiaceae bacterium]